MTLTVANTGMMASPRHSLDTMMDGWATWAGSPNASAAWGTANRAIYIPIRVPVRCVVRKLGAVVESTATGNIDIGLYDAGGTRLVSTGSTAKSATRQTQVVDVTDTTIGPGLFYLALNNSTTTDTFVAQTLAAPLCASRGLLTEALGAVTLPATATWAQDQTLTLAPQIAALLVTEVA